MCDQEKYIGYENVLKECILSYLWR